MKTAHAIVLSSVIALALFAVLLGLVLGGGWWLKRSMPAAQPLPAASSSPAVSAAPVQADAVLSPYRGRLDPTAKPVAQLSLQPMAQDDRLASKVGGRPYWTGDAAYPRDARGQPLALLAQVDLGAMPPLPGYPDHGLLQFFIGGDDFYGANFGDHRADLAALSVQRNFRVVYWPRPEPAARQAAVPLPAADTLPFDPAKPRAMRFNVSTETIGSSDVHFEQALGRSLDDVAAAYAGRLGLPQDTVDEALYDALNRSGHKLGGYPEFTQEDPRAPQDRQVLLLQLDSDDEMMWGDSGIANFFIDPDDLRRGDFSRVAYHWDCY